MKLRLPISIKYILNIYIVGILCFTIFRFILVYKNLSVVHHIPGALGIMSYSMFNGLRFDTVVSGYLLALPALILIIAELGGFLYKKLLLLVQMLTMMLYMLAFFICAADIPFFQNYNNRLNVTILDWKSSPMFMIKMVAQETSYLVYFFLFLLVYMAFLLVCGKVYRRTAHNIQVQATKGKPGFKMSQLVISVIFLGLVMLGIRGRVDEKSPIMVGTAYFCSYDFANQAGLNPVFTFIRSWLDNETGENKKLHFMDNNAAVGLAQQYMGIVPGKINDKYPLYRTIGSEDPMEKHNVVVVIMESMSAYYMQRYGNDKHLTPNLDSLADHGYAFDHFYSAGIHTFNGIFSTLYSFPGVMAEHTMALAVIPSYTGLPYFAKENGYQTTYFTTHDDQFDNVGGFLTANNVDKIYSKDNYPQNEVLSTLGVPDHDMFAYAIPVLNKYHQQGKPFLAMLMTTSNHGPYIVPDDIPFKPKHLEVRKGCVEYADWAIGQFMKNASKQPWFNNTIFVFLGDHGAKEDNLYGDVPLSLNHIACIMYSPLFKDAPKVINKPGVQMDIFPTVAGLLHASYTNNTLGIDLLHENRRWAYFSEDDKIGVVDSNQLYIWHQDGREDLFNLPSREDVLAANRQHADSMKQFAFSMIQTTQYLRDNGKTGPVKTKK